MKKIALIGVGVIALAAAGVPYVTGNIARDAITQGIEQQNAVGEIGKLTLSDYQKGYSSSEALIKWQPKPELAAILETDEVVLKQHIEHGFGSVDWQAEVVSLPVYERYKAANPDGKDPISISGTVQANGDHMTRVDIHKVDYAHIDGSHYKSQPGYITYEQTAGDNIEIDTQIDQFSMVDKDEFKLEIIGLKSTTEGRYEQDIFFGDYEFSADKAQLGQVSSQWQLGNGINLSSAVKRNKDNPQLMDIALDMQLGQILIDDFEHQIADAKMSFALSGLEERVVQLFTQQLNKLDSPNMTDDLTALFLENMTDLIKPGVVLDIDMSVAINGEQNQTSLRLQLNPDFNAQEVFAILFAPDNYAHWMDISMKFALSNDFFQANSDYTGLLINQWFVQQGNTQSLDLALQSGTVNLNGQAMKLSQLLSKF